MSSQHSPHGDGSSVEVHHERLARCEAHPETSHTEHGLTFVVDGWIRMESGSEVQASAGSMLIIPAGVPHRDLGGRDLEYWLVGFCASCLRLDESQVLMQPFRRVRHGAAPLVTVSPQRRGRVIQLFQDLREEAARNAPESTELTRCLVLLLLGEVRRCMSGDDIHSPGSLVADALEFVQRHALKPISLGDVAAAVHRSPAHVAAMVKKATGYPVGTWIRAARVAEAANRLSHTDDSLDEVAAQVGWKDKTHFIRQFRKAYGETPAAWRRARRAERQTG